MPLDPDAVVAGRKSEYFTLGVAQPDKNTLKLNSKMVAKRLMRGLGYNDKTERCGRPTAPELAIEVARPHSLQ
jgi:hypothetical protein